MSAVRSDPYFKKIVSFRPFGRELRFKVSQDLFSTFDVDVGTKFLLRTLPDEARAAKAVLDVGCGYGPIGLAVASASPAADVHMVDRDALACEYARQNAELNGLAGVRTYGSLLYDDVTRSDFDLVLSNMPAKAGEPVLRELLLGAAAHLRPGGLAGVVVVAPLAPFVADVLGAHPDVVMVDRKARSGHVVFMYRRGVPGTPVEPYRSAFDRGVYDRTTFRLTAAGAEFSLLTVFGSPEFDSLSHGTELLLDTLVRLRTARGSDVLVSGPGQGHIPVVVARVVQPRSIALVDRDLLALRNSRRNLIRNGSPGGRITLRHGLAPDDVSDRATLIILALREDEGREAVESTLRRAAERLAPAGSMLIVGSSTAIKRAADLVRGEKLLELRDHRRRLGSAVLVAFASASAA